MAAADAFLAARLDDVRLSDAAAQRSGCRRKARALRHKPAGRALLLRHSAAAAVDSSSSSSSSDLKADTTLLPCARTQRERLMTVLSIDPHVLTPRSSHHYLLPITPFIVAAAHPQAGPGGEGGEVAQADQGAQEPHEEAARRQEEQERLNKGRPRHVGSWRFAAAGGPVRRVARPPLWGRAPAGPVAPAGGAGRAAAAAPLLGRRARRCFVCFLSLPKTGRHLGGRVLWVSAPLRAAPCGGRHRSRCNVAPDSSNGSCWGACGRLKHQKGAAVCYSGPVGRGGVWTARRRSECAGADASVRSVLRAWRSSPKRIQIQNDFNVSNLNQWLRKAELFDPSKQIKIARV